MSWIKRLIPPEIPTTGQTTSYADYDDGYYQTGWPGATRHRDNGDGTIHDFATGLIWVKEPELIIPGSDGDIKADNQVDNYEGSWADDHGTYNLGDAVRYGGENYVYICIVAHTAAVGKEPTEAVWWVWNPFAKGAVDSLLRRNMPWAEALTAPQGLSYAGYADWRLPNVLELITTADWSRDSTGGSIIYSIFPGVAKSYWSSTTEKSKTTAAWMMGGSGDIFTQLKTEYRCVRPVRGGIINA